MRLSLILLLHAALVASALSPGDDLWTRPIRNGDYSMHFYAARHMAERLSAAGRFWGYDAGWMAGFPEGMLGLVDNKLFGVLLWIVPEGAAAAAFNAAVLLMLLAVPWILHAAARTAGSSAGEACGTALAGMALLFAAPLTALFWVSGAIAFVFASVLAVPAALGLTSSLAGERLEPGRGVAAVALAALAIFVHPLAGVPLAAALAPLLLPGGAGKRLRAVGGLGTAAVVIGLTLVPVTAGLEANADHVRPLPRPGGNFPGGIGALVLDWWTLLLNTPGYGDRMYGFFGAGSLAAVLLLAALGALRAGSHRAGARRAVIAVVVVCGVVAYLASSIRPELRALQPHRFLIPLGLFATVPAGWGLVWLLAAMRRGRWQAWLLALLVVVILAEAAWTLRRWNLGSGFDPAEPAIVEFLAGEAEDDGRVLVEVGYRPVPPVEGSGRRIGLFRFTLLPLEHPREFIGTDHMESVVAHRYATFGDGRLFGRPIEEFDGPALRALLDRYAANTVVACSERSRRALDRLSAILERVRDLADCAGYRVREPETSRLLVGHGRVRASLDRLEVRDASGERLVLKYHWIAPLATEPPLPIEEAKIPGAPVGFIAVRPGRVRDFDLVVAPGGSIGIVASAVLRRLGPETSVERENDRVLP